MSRTTAMYRADLDGLVPASVLLLLLLMMTAPLRAQDVDCDATTVTFAESQYQIGRFDRSVGELRQCLPDGFEQKEQRVSAYRLMALNYIVTDSLDLARESIRGLLKTDSGFEPDPDNDPPLFAEMVQDQNQRCNIQHPIRKWQGAEVTLPHVDVVEVLQPSSRLIQHRRRTVDGNDLLDKRCHGLGNPTGSTTQISDPPPGLEEPQ